MAKTIACIIARTVSTRLPLKVLRTVHDNYSLLDYLINRLKKVSEIDEIYLCTSEIDVDDIMEDVAARNNIKLYRGSPDNVIERMLDVAEITGADNVLRITGDNVFTSYEYIGKQITFLNDNQLDYCRIINVPIGATAEVIRVSALKDCYTSIDPAVSEYLLLYIFQPEKYKCGVMKISNTDYSNMTLTVDTPKDLIRTKEIINSIADKTGAKLLDIIELIKNKNIQSAYFTPGAKIKLPYNQSILYDDFQKDMENKIAQSLLLQL